MINIFLPKKLPIVLFFVLFYKKGIDCSTSHILTGFDGTILFVRLKNKTHAGNSLVIGFGKVHVASKPVNILRFSVSFSNWFFENHASRCFYSNT